MVVYFNGQFLPKENVHISPDDRGFVFADGVYEVIRAYKGVFFKAEEHFQRLASNLSKIGITFPRIESLKSVPEKLLGMNDLLYSDASIFVQITRGVAVRKHAFPDQGTSPTVYISSSKFQTNLEKMEKGVRIILVPDIRWSRCDIKSLALLPNVLASQKARESDADEAVFVRNGVITEGSHTTVCAVLDGKLITHPANSNILKGITRQVVLDLCFQHDIRFQEIPIVAKDLYLASECMILGTLTEITPVVQIDDRLVGNGKPGPVTAKLQQAFYEMIKKIKRA